VDFVFPDGRAERLPLMSKDAVARRIVRRIREFDLDRITGFTGLTGLNPKRRSR
jgi:hypothetical protein